MFGLFYLIDDAASFFSVVHLYIRMIFFSDEPPVEAAVFLSGAEFPGCCWGAEGIVFFPELVLGLWMFFDFGEGASLVVFVELLLGYFPSFEEGKEG